MFLTVWGHNPLSKITYKKWNIKNSHVRPSIRLGAPLSSSRYRVQSVVSYLYQGDRWNAFRTILHHFLTPGCSERIEFEELWRTEWRRILLVSYQKVIVSTSVYVFFFFHLIVLRHFKHSVEKKKGRKKAHKTGVLGQMVTKRIRSHPPRVILERNLL